MDQKTFTVLCANGYWHYVPEDMLLGWKLPRNARTKDSEGDVIYHFPKIPEEIMFYLIMYCSYPGTQFIKDVDSAQVTKDVDSAQVTKDVGYCTNPHAQFIKNVIKYHHPVFLFDFIQAAHYFEIKELMDLTCQTLVSMVKRKSVMEIMEKFTNQEYEPSKRAQSSTVCLKRLRERETFIKPSTFVYLQRSRRVTEGLSFIKRRKSYFDGSATKLLNFKSQEDLKMATYSLVGFLNRGQALADRLKYDHVMLLYKVLEQRASQQCTSEDREIMARVLKILSHVSFTALEDVMTEAKIQLLLKVMKGFDYTVAYQAVSALTNIVKHLPKFIGHVLESNALTCVDTALSKNGLIQMIDHVAMFFVTVCRTADLSHHVKVAVATLQKLLEIAPFAEKACYALQYLTYEKELQIDAVMLRNLIRRLKEIIINPPHGNCVYPGYALAVVGNIVRWGSSDQIKILTSDFRILKELRRFIVADCKKIQKEACQIISNIAATMEGPLREVYDARLIDPLCNLLEKDEVDVKMEAAWAIYNSIYGFKFDPSLALPPPPPPQRMTRNMERD